MDAMTLNCPMCGASASTESSKCAHCGARLATIACPVCFGMVFLGAKFCSHCGRAVSREEKETGELDCPRCHVSLKETVIGDAELSECPQCEGVWADSDAFARIQNDRERQAAILATAGRLPELAGVTDAEIRYIYCPVCGEFMNRVNFARCSNVVVDVCKPHGTWLDRDELCKIVEFIQAGGLERARRRQIAELEHQRRQLAAERAEAESEAMRNRCGYDPRSKAVSFVVEVLSNYQR